MKEKKYKIGGSKKHLTSKRTKRGYFNPIKYGIAIAYMYFTKEPINLMKRPLNFIRGLVKIIKRPAFLFSFLFVAP